MDKATFDKIISSPVSISSDEAVLLEELVHEFPYCQMAHLLIANESYRKKSMHYPKKLRRASTYILDRKVLHTLLHHKEIAEGSDEIILQKEETEIKQETEQQEDEPFISQKNVEILKELEQNLTDLKRKKEELKNLNIVRGSSQLNILPIAVNTQKQVFNESKFGEELSTGELKNIDLLLDYLQKNHFTPQEPGENEDKINQNEIIDKFITAQPKLSPRSSVNIYEEENSDLSVESTELKLELITENYALILTKQNKIEKAKEVYKKLLLKYPDKSAYFALKLNELESR